MKKILITTALLGGVGLFGYSIYSFYKKQAELLKQFTWKLKSFNFTEISENLVKATIIIRFESISDIELTVTKMYLDIGLNGHNVGYITDVNPFVLPARGYNDIPINVTINPQYILSNIADIALYATKQKDANISIKGNVSIKSGFIAVTVPINCDCSMQKLDCNCA